MIFKVVNLIRFRIIRLLKARSPRLPAVNKWLSVCFLLLYFVAGAQVKNSNLFVKDSTIKPKKTTPFNPQGNYETMAIKTRVLPWFIGDNTGTNILIGFELGFFKYHSVSADFVKGISNENLDAYYRNDSTILPVRERNMTSREFHFAYNYHLAIPILREKLGLSFYTGVNYRIGKWKMESDTGMYVNDHTSSSSREYYSFGPQVGALWNVGKKDLLALNLNISTFYNVKNVATTEIIGNTVYKHASVFKTVDLRVGVNLYFWLKYRKNR